MTVYLGYIVFSCVRRHMKVAIYSYKLARIKVSNIKLIVFTLSLSLELLDDFSKYTIKRYLSQ